MMDNAKLNTTLIDNYFELFRRLSTQGKQELIAKLKKSIQKDNNQESAFFSSFGSFKCEASADELISDIKNSRTVNRNITEF